jgi:hypothetical protein
MAEWIVAAVVGVVVGWVLRGSGACNKTVSVPAPSGDLDLAQTQIKGLEAMVNGRDAAIAALEKELASK